MLFSFHPSQGQQFTAGMDLSLTCLGGNDYLIRLTFYRECSGGAPLLTASFVLECTTDSTNNFNVTGVPIKAGSGVEVTPVCQTMATHCSSGSIHGIEEYVYETQVTLPPCNHWRIGWSGNGTHLNGYCCRLPSNTITSPTSQYIYTEVTLNNLHAPCVSTPTFTQPPQTMFCTNQTQCVNPGAVDPDGDSLSYSLVTPMTNGNQGTVNWIPPFTATQPFPSMPAISLDPVTGTLCMSPTMNIISPMAIRVQKWRDINNTPQVVATSYRDIQINVFTCNNQVPSLSGMDPSLNSGYDPFNNTFTKVACLGDTVRFAIWGFDPDLPDTTWGDREKFSISWNSGIPQADFQAFHNNTDSAYAIFTWVPELADTRDAPHCFTATIRDGACPYNGMQSYGYCLFVKGIKVDIGSDTLLCRGESITIEAVTQPPAVYHLWQLNGIPTGTPLANSSYTLSTDMVPSGEHVVSVQVTDGTHNFPCPGMATVVVDVVVRPNPDLGSDAVVYDNTPVTLDAGPGAMYLWNTGDTTQQITVNTTGLYSVVVDGGYGTRCTGTDSVFIEFIIGVDEPDGRSALTVYPNPTTGEVTLQLPEQAEGVMEAQVFSVEGRLVFKQQIHPDPNGRMAFVNIGHLPAGIYLLKLHSSRHSLVAKLVKE